LCTHRQWSCIGLPYIRTNPFVLHRCLCSFEQLYDTKSGNAVGNRTFSGLDTGNEMLAGNFEWLCLIDLRHQQVARAILHEDLVPIVVFEQIHTFIENLYLMLKVEMVVNDHLAAAANQRPAQLYR